MKIALFVHCFFPGHFYGTETYTLELARHFRAKGHDVTVVSAIFQGEPEASDLITRYEYQGIPVVCIDKNRVPHSRVKETYYQPEMRQVLEEVLRQIAPDVIHVAHLINHTAALLEVAQSLAIPTYATLTDFFGFCLNNKLEAADGSLCRGPSPSRTNCTACYLKDAANGGHAEGWMGWATSPLAAKLVANCANVIRCLPGVKGGPMDGLVEDIAKRPDTLRTLYNNTYKAVIAPTNFLGKAYKGNGLASSMFDIRFGIDIDRSPKPGRPSGYLPVIGFIGQIAPHKGTDILVEAFANLPAGLARLKIYGPEDQDVSYMAKLRALADGRDVQFLGTFPKEQMAEVLRELDILVIPSRWYENSPLVLLNALATHTPVIVSDVEGMTEFLDPGRNGYSFKRGSVADLGRLLAAMTAVPDKIFSLAKTTHYDRTTEMMAEETLAIYERAA